MRRLYIKVEKMASGFAFLLRGLFYAPTLLFLCFSFLAPVSVYAIYNSREIESWAKISKSGRFDKNDEYRIVIHGVVTDADGVPLAGVTVKVKGENTGNFTDDKGQFTVDAPKDAVLEITYVGYKKKEVPVNGRQSITIVLEPDVSSLDQFVVVGYGKQRKLDLTSAVSTVDVEDLQNRPTQNVLQSLQGTVPGLNIAQNNGSLESTPSFNIRGIGTIGTSSSSPLILIDGMEGDIASINPQDIKSISVLKDASASAIYGSRAAFGVILVTTKTGHKGRIKVGYNDNFRWSKPLMMPDQMDSYTWARYINAANINGGNNGFFDADHLKRIEDYRDGKITATDIPDPNNPTRWGDGYVYGNANVDWYDAMYRDFAFSQEHNISLSGGGEKTTYYISGNYMGQNGLMEFNQDYRKRYGTTVKINSQVSQFITIGYSNRYIHEGYQRPSNLTNTFYQDLARQGWPTLPLYDPNGFLFTSPSPALAMAEGGKDNTQTDWDYQQVKIIISPVAGWNIYAIGDYRSKEVFRHWDIQQLYNHNVNGDEYLYSTNSGVYEYGYKEDYFNTNIYSEYENSFDGVHHFKVMAGFQSELTKYRDLSAHRDGIIVPSIATINTTSGADPEGVPIVPTVSGQYQSWSIAGFFGRLNYDYKDRYLFEGSLRYDGSSRFRKRDRWVLSPSFSLGWNVGEERFWEGLKHNINSLKIRASFGTLGNQNTTNWYPTYVSMPIGTANGGWLVDGAKPNTAVAPGLISSVLTWESVKTVDIGLDFGLLNDRLTGSFDWFTRYTLDMVGPAPELPVILGTDVPQTNNTDLKTYGIEAEVSWRDRLSNGLSYDLHFNVSDNQTIVTKYPNPSGLLSTYVQGRKLGEIWGYTSLGIARTQEQMDKHLATLNGGQNAIGSEWGAGDIMYADYNGDGKLDKGKETADDPGDLHVIGNNTPRYMFGFVANGRYKGFDIRIFLQGTMKRDIWQGSPFFWGVTGAGQWWATGFVEHQDYFRSDADDPMGKNVDSFYPRPLFSDKNEQVQTRYLLNAAYVRLKNLQIGYSLPTSYLNKLGVESLRFYVSGENLWTGSKMADMFDPETVDGGSGGNVYPLQKVYSCGVSVTF